MKVIGVIGSYRGASNSAKIVKEILRGAREAGHETVVYELKGELKGCIGCRCCKRPDWDGFCAQKDILTPYFEDLKGAGAVILSAAIYMGYPQGETFTFMNRHYCLHAENRFDGKAKCRIEPGKKLIPVFGQGAPDNPKYRANCEALTKPFEGWGFDISEPVVVSGAMGGASEALLAEAYEMGKNL